MTAPATEATCAGCAHWERLCLMDDEHGRCHRYPPVYESAPGYAGYAQPIIHETCWCAEHTRRAEG